MKINTFNMLDSVKVCLIKAITEHVKNQGGAITFDPTIRYGIVWGDIFVSMSISEIYWNDAAEAIFCKYIIKGEATQTHEIPISVLTIEHLCLITERL